MGKGGHCLKEKANERETGGVRWNWIRTTHSGWWRQSLLPCMLTSLKRKVKKKKNQSGLLVLFVG